MQLDNLKILRTENPEMICYNEKGKQDVCVIMAHSPACQLTSVEEGSRWVPC